MKKTFNITLCICLSLLLSLLSACTPSTGNENSSIPESTESLVLETPEESSPPEESRPEFTDNGESSSRPDSDDVVNEGGMMQFKPEEDTVAAIYVMNLFSEDEVTDRDLLLDFPYETASLSGEPLSQDGNLLLIDGDTYSTSKESGFYHSTLYNFKDGKYYLDNTLRSTEQRYIHLQAGMIGFAYDQDIVVHDSQHLPMNISFQKDKLAFLHSTDASPFFIGMTYDAQMEQFIVAYTYEKKMVSGQIDVYGKIAIATYDKSGALLYDVSTSLETYTAAFGVVPCSLRYLGRDYVLVESDASNIPNGSIIHIKTGNLVEIDPVTIYQQNGSRVVYAEGYNMPVDMAEAFYVGSFNGERFVAERQIPESVNQEQGPVYFRPIFTNYLAEADEEIFALYWAGADHYFVRLQSGDHFIGTYADWREVDGGVYLGLNSKGDALFYKH